MFLQERTTAKMSDRKDINIDVPCDDDNSQQKKKSKGKKIEKTKCAEQSTNNAEEVELSDEMKKKIADAMSEKIQQEVQSEKDKYMRLMAEYDNYRKRTAKEKTEIYGDAVINCVSEIIPVLDNFERAFETECGDEKFKSGMEMIFNQFKTIFEKLGVKEIEALNQPFDPNLHNAIKQVQNDDAESDTVCEVYQKGYMLNDRVIRHAMVAVNA